MSSPRQHKATPACQSTSACRHGLALHQHGTGLACGAPSQAKSKPMTDYSLIDQPAILKYIFYPRKDFTSCPRNAFDLFVAVEDRVSISCRFYMGHHEWPWILFFHGNGEVVSDYDEISPFYHQKRLNLVVADYRGYGASRGTPTLTHLVQDSRVIFREVRAELSRRNLRSDLWVMGRSLGSISALELAYQYQEAMKGLIIESGFPSMVRIIMHLGIPAYGIDLSKIDQESLGRIKKIFIPSLIIHGGRDMLVPLGNARDLYEHLGTQEKELLVIPSATHNDIMMIGFKDYFEALQRFIEKMRD
jgi:pimeloyl-ACP methyl ester carboxylesterase